MNNNKITYEQQQKDQCCEFVIVEAHLQMNNNITYKQQQQSGYELLKTEQEIYVDWSSCCCSCVILLLLICNCGGTLTDEQQQKDQSTYISY